MVQAEATQPRRPETAGQISRAGCSGRGCTGPEAWGSAGPQATPLPLCEHGVWPGTHPLPPPQQGCGLPAPPRLQGRPGRSPVSPWLPPLNCCPVASSLSHLGHPCLQRGWLGVQQVGCRGGGWESFQQGQNAVQLPGETEQALCERPSVLCLTPPTDRASHTPSGLLAPTFCFFCDHQHTGTL